MCDSRTAQKLYIHLTAGRLDEAYQTAAGMFNHIDPDLDHDDREKAIQAVAGSIVNRLYSGGCDRSRAELFVAGVLWGIKQRECGLVAIAA